LAYCKKRGILCKPLCQAHSGRKMPKLRFVEYCFPEEALDFAAEIAFVGVGSSFRQLLPAVELGSLAIWASASKRESYIRRKSTMTKPFLLALVFFCYSASCHAQSCVSKDDDFISGSYVASKSSDRCDFGGGGDQGPIQGFNTANPRLDIAGSPSRLPFTDRLLDVSLVRAEAFTCILCSRRPREADKATLALALPKRRRA